MTAENDKRGRPRIKINYDALDAMLQFKVTKKFCAEYLGVSEDTIEKCLREDKDMTFTEYHAHKIQSVGIKLQQKAIDAAMRGNAVLMIFCLKNLCGWTDKQEVHHSNDAPIEIKYVRDDA